MRVLRSAAVALCFCVLGVQAAAFAADATVYIHDNFYDPGFSPATLGDKVTWSNLGGTTHTVTSDLAAPLSDPTSAGPFFDSSPIGFAGGSYQLDVRAGTFGYHCTIHGFAMRGVVSVPVLITPTGTVHEYAIGWQTIGTKPGYAYDVQIRRPGSKTWRTIFRNDLNNEEIFTATRRGAYRFRARIKFEQTGAHSGWSPPAVLVVS